MGRLALVAALGLAMGASSRAEPSIDLHAHWDQRCGNCHGDAADFARRSLSVEAGTLQGVHHRHDLDRFLRQHYLADELVAPVSAMLAAQLATPPTFKAACASCHGRAADLARASLAIVDGVLIAQGRGQPVSQVLQGHGGLEPPERAAMVQTLTRVRSEVAGPRRK